MGKSVGIFGSKQATERVAAAARRTKAEGFWDDQWRLDRAWSLVAVKQ
jgi:hypothetical protein